MKLLLTAAFACTLLAGCGAPTLPKTPAMAALAADLDGPGKLARIYAHETQMGTGARDERDAAPLPAAPDLVGTFSPSAARPARVDLRAGFPPVDHQGPFMSCTAFAVAKGLGEFLLRKRGDQTPLSASHFYAMTAQARFLMDTRDTFGTRPWAKQVFADHSVDDDGRLLSAAVATLEWGGAIAERNAPYPPASTWSRYSVEQYENALKPQGYGSGPLSRRYLEKWFRSTTYDVEPGGTLTYDGIPTKLRITQAEKVSGLDGFRRSLARGMPVAFGMVLHEGAYDPEVKRTGLLPLQAPGKRLVGGHAMLAVGYDDATRLILVRNSWGPEWGEGGYGRLSYAAFNEGTVSAGWTVSDAQQVVTSALD